MTNITWDRYRAHPRYNKANYRLVADGEPTSTWVNWCGHPTANRPYYIRHKGEMCGTHPTVVAAKEFAEALFTGRCTIEPDGVIVWQEGRP